MTSGPPLIVVAGATATGKTELGIRLAERVQASGRAVTVISADSRQVYRGLDIGTAKVSAADRARVPHVGLDLVDPDAPFSLADFMTHARAALDALLVTDGIAFLVGGTGLYLRAVATGLDTDALPSDPEVRARLERDLVSDGLSSLVDRLEALAPERAEAIDLRNPRRVVRALEIAELSGGAPVPAPPGYPGPVLWLGLRLGADAHRRRIEQRASSQFDAGLIDEADALRQRFDPELPAFSAIGYREAWAVMDGQSTLEEAIGIDARRNLKFAKRQATWFRSESDIRWLDADARDLDVVAAAAVRPLVER